MGDWNCYSDTTNLPNTHIISNLILMNNNSISQLRMREYLQLVATGPELSKSLNESQAEDGMAMILNGDIDSVRAGIFLIALRMKRETDAENIGILNALMGAMEKANTESPNVLAIADPFNGYLRTLTATPFLPPVFAACGLPTYIHGLKSVGPKYGITANLVLSEAGCNVDVSVRNAVSVLDNSSIGWTYLDQEHYIPRLHDLVELRDTMVKRTCISTLEVVLRPICGSSSTHLMTGFVHKAYPPVYAKLAACAGFTSVAIVRGVEGGCIPSLSQVSRYFDCPNETLNQVRLSPKDLGIDQENRGVIISDQFLAKMKKTGYQNTDKLEDVVKQNLSLGLNALNNNSGAMLDSIVFAVAIGLAQVGMVSNLNEGAEKARQVITSGDALSRFNAGRTVKK